MKVSIHRASHYILEETSSLPGAMLATVLKRELVLVKQDL